MNVKMIAAVVGVGVSLFLGGYAIQEFLSGCKSSPKDEHGKHIAERTEDGFILQIRGIHHSFQYVMIDGHEYLVMNPSANHADGLAHSPKCQCMNRRRDD